MLKRRPIETAPRDGSRVRVFWTNEDGEESESIARYHSVDRLRRAGGDWEEADEGWWIFVNGHTQRRVEPTAWVTADEEEDD